MAGNRRKLTTRQLKAIDAILKRHTNSEVASISGVSERTLYRWLKQEEFTSELRRAEGRLLEGAVRRLVLLAEDAVVALEDVLKQPSQRGASVKRLAAKDVLELLMKWRETLTFEERLSRLEDKVYYGKE